MSDIPLPPDDPFFPPDLGVREQDPEKAKSLLASAGYPDGLDVELFTSQVYSAMPNLAEAFAQSAKAAGVRAKVKQWPPATYWDEVWLKKPLYTSYWQLRYPPDDLWFMYGTEAFSNETRRGYKEIDDLYTKALATADADEQKKYVQEGHLIAADKMGHILPVASDSVWLGKKRLQGVVGHPQYKVLLTRAYLAKA
jgi:peptide/nickel transport system substrate-binding protein